MKRPRDFFSWSESLEPWYKSLGGIEALRLQSKRSYVSCWGCFRRPFCAVKSIKKKTKTVRPSWYESWKDENFRLLFVFSCFDLTKKLTRNVSQNWIWMSVKDTLMFWGPKQKDQDDGHKSVGSNHGCLVQRNQGGASNLESLLECCGGGSIFLFSRKTARTNSTITRWRISVLHLDSRILIKSIADRTVIWDEVVGQQNTGKCVGKTGKPKVTFWKFHCLKSPRLFESFH